MIRIQIPPEGQWSALAQYKSCIRNSDKGRDRHDDPDDPDMDGMDRDAQQEQPNGDLEDGGTYCVEHFAEEPESEGYLRLFVSEVFTFLTRTMDSTAHLARKIGCVEYQCNDHHLVIEPEALDEYSPEVRISFSSNVGTFRAQRQLTGHSTATPRLSNSG